MIWTFYDPASGRIIGTVDAPDDDPSTVPPPGAAAIAGQWLPDGWWVQEGEALPRPEIGQIDGDLMPADMPPGTKVFVARAGDLEEAEMPAAPGSSLGLPPGRWRIVLVPPFPWRQAFQMIRVGD